ncbi:uncharacterized protein B0H18DRAFT_968454 [Fomitopsis serialis]|uniref:uncharacterized protein n=1 Tax=Fomitopsis serialis TaxID=139415 RepID=UPI0020073199|nr:uncharacterized protein B0H18DRAFT_968454 [Neoantrodia serialis]KAH9938727.1 hypothetical protein B0H18DRAFT_968454 [Neoantrodia serialis]
MATQVQAPTRIPSPDLDRPTSNAPDAPDTRPSSSSALPKNRRTTFDLEPNPFEQSFARPSNDSSQQRADRSHSGSPPSPKPVLPPLARSPPRRTLPTLGLLGSHLSNSCGRGPCPLRCSRGPNPTPTTTSRCPPSTPPPSAPAYSRTGLTPGTGLTPLIGGPVSFPPPSPNTAAFLAMMQNSSGATPSLSSVAGTITPNTLSAITGVLSTTHHSHSHATTNPSPLSMHAYQPQAPGQSQPREGNGNGNGYSSNAATNSAANGLFLLSQAHQELAKREAQAAAAATPTPTALRTRARLPPPMATALPRLLRPHRLGEQQAGDEAESVAQEPASGKRTRSSTASSATQRRGSVPSMDGEEEEEDDDMMDPPPPPSKKGGAQKKPETEEEKRRNFLERNRQAALKCRQRKKAWLSQLQAKVEYLSNENERLTAALVASREEISRLSALVGAASVGPAVSMGGSNVGVNGSHVPVNGGPPISVSVTMPPGGKSATAMVGGGGRVMGTEA